MIVVDKMVNYRLVEPSHVLAWIFDTDGGQKDFQRSYVWTILKNVMNKVSTRVHGISRKLDTMRATLSASDSAMEMDEEEQQQEKKPANGTITQEDVDEWEAKLDAAQREKKQLFMDVMQHFLRVLQPYLDTPQEQTTWFQWTEGMFREVGRCVCERGNLF